MKSSRDEYLYDNFLSMLPQIDSRHHSCLADLALLKDYQTIMRNKLEGEDNGKEKVKRRYTGLYSHEVNAEKMRRYIIENAVDYYAVNKWDLFVLLKNGDKFIYDSFSNTVEFDLYENDELTRDQKIKEFTRNLKKILDRNFMTQEELANRIGVSRITINRYATGKQVPDYLTLSEMARILKCSVDDFYYKKY